MPLIPLETTTFILLPFTSVTVNFVLRGRSHSDSPAASLPVASTRIPIGKIPFVPAGFVTSRIIPLSLANLFPIDSFISVDEKDFSTNVSPGFRLRKPSKYSLLNLSDDIPRNVVIGVSRTGAFEIIESKSLTILLTFTVSLALASYPPRKTVLTRL